MAQNVQMDHTISKHFFSRFISLKAPSFHNFGVEIQIHEIFEEFSNHSKKDFVF